MERGKDGRVRQNRAVEEERTNTKDSQESYMKTFYFVN